MHVFDKWGDTYSISYDIVVNAVPPDARNIFHFTTGGNYGSLGDRLPALFYIADPAQSKYEFLSKLDQTYLAADILRIPKQFN